MSLPNTLTDPQELGFDPEAIRAKYKVERDRRMRDDTTSQFVAVGPTSKYSRYLLEDPFAPEPGERAPLTDEVEFLIIGGGWAGLMMASRLNEVGVTDVRIVEAGSEFGGTWYWNRYPGAQCDVQSYVYMPLLEETGYMPKERYAYAPELLEHARRIGEKFDLYKKAVFQTWVTDVRWDDKALRWVIKTNRGDAMRARFLGVATGPASRARLPGIPGIDEFKGKSFHTSRWDYNYTGGGHSEIMTGLADKRVAVIGTGATAIQCVPRVAASAKQTYVFQRTPSSVGERGNAPTDPEWAASLEPGWQRKMMDAFDQIILGGPVDESLLKTETMLRTSLHTRELLKKVDPTKLSRDELMKIVELAGFVTAEEIRGRVDSTVANPEVAEKLKHWYMPGCKRPTFNDEYLDAFNRPNVELIDVSDAKGIDRITEKGVVANGKEYEVDCIVYASGFEITSDFDRRIGVPIYGKNGVSIYDHWKDGMRTVFNVMVHGFPNMFVIGGIFGFTLSLNYSGVLDDQTKALAKLTKAIKDRGAAAQVSTEAEDAWIHEQISTPASGISNTFGNAAETCTPGYYNQEGKPVEQRRDTRREGYGPGGFVYSRKVREWIDGNMEGLEMIGG